jgi:hypothetical protein
MDGGDGQLDVLWLALTPTEAQEFRDALDGWLTDWPNDPNWHFHIMDGHGRTLTVDIVEAADARFAKGA